MGEAQASKVTSPIRSRGVAELLSDELRSKIVSGEIADGGALPSERELSEQSGLGRSSVREALRTLEAEGLVTVRAGRSGGVTVHRPSSKTLSRSIGLLVSADPQTMRGLAEFREMLEPRSAGMAAARRQQSDLDELERCNNEMARLIAEAEGGEQRRTELIALNARFHVAIFEATQNPFLKQLMIATEETLRTNVALAYEYDHLRGDRVFNSVLATHRSIADAISRGDAEAAELRMKQHVTSYAKAVREPVSDPNAV